MKFSEYTLSNEFSIIALLKVIINKSVYLYIKNSTTTVAVATQSESCLR